MHLSLNWLFSRQTSGTWLRILFIHCSKTESLGITATCFRGGLPFPSPHQPTLQYQSSLKNTHKPTPITTTKSNWLALSFLRWPPDSTRKEVPVPLCQLSALTLVGYWEFLKETVEVITAGFAEWMPFLLPNQQRQRTKWMKHQKGFSTYILTYSWNSPT